MNLRVCGMEVLARALKEPPKRKVWICADEPGLMKRLSGENLDAQPRNLRGGAGDGNWLSECVKSSLWPSWMWHHST